MSADIEICDFSPDCISVGAWSGHKWIHDSLSQTSGITQISVACSQFSAPFLRVSTPVSLRLCLRKQAPSELHLSLTALPILRKRLRLQKISSPPSCLRKSQRQHLNSSDIAVGF